MGAKHTESLVKKTKPKSEKKNLTLKFCALE